MALATYSDLVSAIGAWLDRTDMDARVPDFIALVEARINRILSDPDMEVTATTTASSEFTALPSDFGEMVSLTTSEGELRAMGPADYAGIDHTISGTPKFYVIVDGSISFVPADSTAALRMVYRRTVPPLTSTDTTNWLLARAPDVYLYGSLLEAADYIAEPGDRVAVWAGKYERALSEMIVDGTRRKWGAGPIAPRIRRL